MPRHGTAQAVKSHMATAPRQQRHQLRVRLPVERKVGIRWNPWIVPRMDDQGRRPYLTQERLRCAAGVVVVSIRESVGRRDKSVVEIIDCGDVAKERALFIRQMTARRSNLVLHPRQQEIMV